MTISDDALAEVIAVALQAGDGKVEINAPALAAIARELRDRRDADTQTSMCALCYGTGEVVTAISRYGAPSKCTECGGAGRVRR